MVLTIGRLRDRYTELGCNLKLASVPLEGDLTGLNTLGLSAGDCLLVDAENIVDPI